MFQNFQNLPETYFLRKYFHLEKKSRNIFEHLCRSKIFQRFQKSYLKNQPSKLKIRKMKNNLFFAQMSQIPLPGWRNLCVVTCVTALALRARISGTPLLQCEELAARDGARSHARLIVRGNVQMDLQAPVEGPVLHMKTPTPLVPL